MSQCVGVFITCRSVLHYGELCCGVLCLSATVSKTIPMRSEVVVRWKVCCSVL